VLSLFQETYDKTLYQKIFGVYEPCNPKSNYNRRLSTPERWIRKGFRCVDLGILLGLNNCFKQDLDELIKHATYLYNLGAIVYLSLPRIYMSGKIIPTVSDENFIQSIHILRQACPWAKLIITTRESIAMIRKVFPYIDVVSPGSSDVMPYTWEGDISNDEKTSQFKVAEKRKRPAQVLKELGICES